jgi:hypothetical protein
MTLSQFRRPGTLWYVSDGFIWDDLPSSHQTELGRPLECSAKLFVFNPQSEIANITVRFYHIDRPPTAIHFGLGPQEIKRIELASLAEVPHRQAFWIVLESDIPVLPQARHEDFTLWDLVPDALIAVAPYPGPLRDETAWVFPDCYQSAYRADGRKSSWYERELLTILNPGSQPVTVRVRYLTRYRDLGAEEEIEIPAERVAALDVWERNPPLLGNKNGPPIRVVGDYAVRLDATGPIIAQTTRRARWTGYAPVVGARSTMAFPVRNEGHKLWYYPGGEIVDRGVLPRAKEGQHPLTQCDNTWNLLFINNLDEERPLTATITFHKPDGSQTSALSSEMPPLKSALECLHGQPWLEAHTRVNEPYAMVVTADRPVVPEVTGAEFEMWSQVCPGAMSAVNFYPGPLEDERTWWLGIGQAGGSDELNTDWTQSYHLFNPGQEKIRVSLSFLGLPDRSQPLTHTVEIGPGAVARLHSDEIEGLPVDQPFAVRADGDGPYCAQLFGRTFTRGLPYTRAMYSMIGLPMRLVEE